MYCSEEYWKYKEELIVNSEDLKGKWTQLKGNVQKQWGKLTNDDLDVIEGNTDILVGKLQERYDISEEEARRQVNEYKL